MATEKDQRPGAGMLTTKVADLRQVTVGRLVTDSSIARRRDVQRGGDAAAAVPVANFDSAL